MLTNVASPPLYASRGIAVGGALAVFELVMAMVAGLGEWIAKAPSSEASIRVDDIRVATASSARDAVAASAFAWATMVDTVRSSWTMELAIDKQCSLAPCHRVESRLRRAMGQWVGARSQFLVL